MRVVARVTPRTAATQNTRICVRRLSFAFCLQTKCLLAKKFGSVRIAALVIDAAREVAVVARRHGAGEELDQDLADRDEDQ